MHFLEPSPYQGAQQSWRWLGGWVGTTLNPNLYLVLEAGTPIARCLGDLGELLSFGFPLSSLWSGGSS